MLPEERIAVATRLVKVVIGEPGGGHRVRGWDRKKPDDGYQYRNEARHTHATRQIAALRSREAHGGRSDSPAKLESVGATGTSLSSEAGAAEAASASSGTLRRVLDVVNI